MTNARRELRQYRLTKTDTDFLLCLPSLLVPPTIVFARQGGITAEVSAAFAVTVLAFPFCIVPAGMLGLHAFCKTTDIPFPFPHSILEFSAIWMVWNSHLFGYAAFVLPFFFLSFITTSSYSNILYDYFVFVTFIPSPVVLGSAILKFFSLSVKWRWGIAQRALLGTVLGVVTLMVWAGCFFFRRESVVVTVCISLLFYLYTVLTYLPPLCLPMAPAPEVSGVRTWPLLRSAWAKERLWSLVISYLQLRVISDESRNRSNKKSDVSRKAIWGFHPHGIIPYTAGLMTVADTWPFESAPIFLSDFATHLVPVMRDMIQWMGAREVSKSCIESILKNGGAVTLVPGGQAEIFSSKSWGTEVEVFVGHKGFVRLALKHGCDLVPVFSFGEWELMDNIYLPAVQKPTRKMFGFPIPFVPIGKWNLPMPRRPKHGITIVVGKPLPARSSTPRLRTGFFEPTEEDVERVHKAYFDAIRDLWERYKHEAGYGGHTLRFTRKRRRRDKEE